MSKTVTLTSLIESVRKLGEWNEPFFPEVQLVKWINEGRDELYAIVSRLEPERYTSEDSISVVSGTSSYNLPSDFLWLNGVEIADTSRATGRRTVGGIEYAMRNEYFINGGKDSAVYYLKGPKIVIVPTPQWSGTMYLDYVPVLTDLATGSDAMDGVNGWQTYVIMHAAILCAGRDGTDGSVWEKEKVRVEHKIKSANRMDRANPMTIPDTRGARSARRGYGRRWRS